MAFIAYDIALEIVTAMREPLARIRHSDGPLADQARRAAQSIVLNVAEANARLGRDRGHLFSVAAGSVAEVRAALDVACAWGYVDAAAVAPLRGLLDREARLLHGLTRRRAA